ncbi:substrate-binding domain-containing protein [Pseudarthrobacter psychrotolerans]|uniref:Substrate-binding domain-containing protein n=1 Tax=Pseudarthrobacter psychrotolerans TaxID=2697569 RepID=A0A6P1NMS9_9MICC|nr:substrate-binding domain-containing protein [Pseudarthrobacter psychrotolerans]
MFDPVVSDNNLPEFLAGLTPFHPDLRNPPAVTRPAGGTTTCRAAISNFADHGVRGRRKIVKIRKLLGTVAVVLAVTVGATGCGSRGGTAAEPAASDAAGSLVGISMPTQTSERWIADGKNVSESVTKLGYKADLQYANDDIPTQVAQIENMLTKGAKALIVAAIDGTTLTDVLAKAKEQNVKVIAYDRLINGTPNVDFYTTFDNYTVGVQQATSLLTGLGLIDAAGKKVDGKGPFNVELFAGSPDDNNANFFWTGAMDTLKPFMDAGTLKVPSGQTKFEQAAILRWQAPVAQKRMEDILTAAYSSGTKLNGVLSPYDGLSIGIISALTSTGGYAKGSLPIVTGQDAEKGSVKSITAGEQYSTIFKDTRQLGAQAVKMVDALLKGQQPEVNDTKTYNNKVKVVPAYLLKSVIITNENYKKELIDSGYYTEADVK